MRVTGEEERKFMSKKTKKVIKYTDEDLGEVEVIHDFLPNPSELILKKESIKVTLSLSKNSVSFFKKMAKKNNTQYQKMIRALIDRYAEEYKEAG